MLRFNEIAFGPVFSRRLGSSLGVNLLPVGGKLCNFDCIYCELGWNRDGVTEAEMPDSAQVKDALEKKLSECSDQGVPVDSITFSGNGEPTLNPDFPEIVDVAINLRNTYYPRAKVTVFSNSTTLGNPEVVRALEKVDNPVLKVDALTLERIDVVNRPVCRWNLQTIKKGMTSLGGKFVLQTIFFSSEDFDTAPGVSQWMDFVREVRPRQIMVYTIDRETPLKGLRKYSVEEMTEMVKPLINEGFDVQIRG